MLKPLVRSSIVTGLTPVSYTHLANRYADTDTVKQAIGSTQLHKIVVVYKGMEMRVCEEL